MTAPRTRQPLRIAFFARAQGEHTYRKRAAQVEEQLRQLAGPPHIPAVRHHARPSSLPAHARA